MKKREAFPFLGSVSSGTIRAQDLIPRFLAVLRELAPEETKRFEETWGADLFLLQNPTGIRKDTKDLQDSLLSDLFDTLCEFAPAGYYFGAHPGDGADYGFWKIEE